MRLLEQIELECGGPGSGRHSSSKGAKITFGIQKSLFSDNFKIVPQAGKKSIGWLMVSIDNGEAHIDGASLDKNFQGQCHGRKMYELAIKHLKENHPEVKALNSSGTMSTDANRVWNSLKRDYKVIGEKGNYKLHLKASAESVQLVNKKLKGLRGRLQELDEEERQGRENSIKYWNKWEKPYREREKIKVQVSILETRLRDLQKII